MSIVSDFLLYYSLSSLKGPAEHDKFPADIEELIRQEIDRLLDEYKATPDDIAITAGMAAGGDLIFIESCVARKIPVGTHMPVPESQYVRDFVSAAGDTWVERFYKMRNHPLVVEHYQTELVGNPKPNDDVLERNNRWALYSAMVRGVDNLKLIALFDDKHGALHATQDTRLVKHMIDLTRDAGGQVEIANPFKPTALMPEEKPRTKHPASKKKETPKEKTQEVE